jgi:hypothetical protein
MSGERDGMLPCRDEHGTPWSMIPTGTLIRTDFATLSESIAGVVQPVEDKARLVGVSQAAGATFTSKVRASAS